VRRPGQHIKPVRHEILNCRERDLHDMQITHHTPVASSPSYQEENSTPPTMDQRRSKTAYVWACVEGFVDGSMMKMCSDLDQVHCGKQSMEKWSCGVECGC
jgi:hypothetical protein